MPKKQPENIEEIEAHWTNGPMRPRLLTLKQAAAYLGRGEDSLRELVYSGAFPVVQLGERSKMWLDVADLDNWIQSNKKFLRN